jgi:methylamine dehydrogenase accessory protein MauD
MTEALLVSNALLWALVAGLSLVVVALARQIGLLHERIAPVGALASARGPQPGEAAPQLALQSLSGASVEVGSPDAHGRRTLLFFLSPTCPVCKTLLPTLRRMLGEEAESLRVVYASDGASEEHARFASEHGLSGADYVLSQTLGLRFEVAKLPYAVLIDAAGIVRARGLVNTREHLESLFEAERLAVGSLQQYLAREAAPFQVAREPAREMAHGGAAS